MQHTNNLMHSGIRTHTHTYTDSQIHTCIAYDADDDGNKWQNMKSKKRRAYEMEKQTLILSENTENHSTFTLYLQSETNPCLCVLFYRMRL